MLSWLNLIGETFSWLQDSRTT